MFAAKLIIPFNLTGGEIPVFLNVVSVVRFHLCCNELIADLRMCYFDTIGIVFTTLQVLPPRVDVVFVVILHQRVVQHLVTFAFQIGSALAATGRYEYQKEKGDQSFHKR